MADWVDRLLADQTMAPRTIAQYSAGLRYWDTWHQLRYGTPLPLAETPPRALSADAVSTFIDDHLAVAVEGRLRMRMTVALFDGLREAGYNARIECVAPATSDWRLQVLQQAHRLLRVRVDRELIRHRKPEIYAVWEAERAALGIPLTVPMSASSTVDALLRACSDDREGTMDLALILFLRRLTPSQVAALRFSELTPGTTVKNEEELDAVALTVRKPVSDMQRFLPKVVFVGEEATLIKMWGAIREDEVVHGNDDWFFVRKSRSKASAPLNHTWIARRIRSLAQQAGLADADGRTRVSPQWLRKAHERETREESTMVKVARAAGVSTRSAFNLTREARARLTLTND